jgi:hypothetical protein
MCCCCGSTTELDSIAIWAVNDFLQDYKARLAEVVDCAAAA